MNAQVYEIAGATDQRICRLREQCLPAMARGCDPRRPMHIHPGVFFTDNDRLACVEAHAHSKAGLGESGLASDAASTACRALGNATKIPSPSMSTSTPQAALA